MPTDPVPPATLVLYWDYELQYGADACMRGPRDWGLDDYRQTACLLGTLEIFDVPCTFAILGAAAEQGDLPYCSPGQVREIASLGHEIASHSHLHEFLPSLDRDSLLETLRRSRQTLEQTTGRAVVSFVPPHDYPTRLLRRGALGFAQARYGGGWIGRGIPWLCRALRSTGYRTCRVSYRRLSERLRGSRIPAGPESIHGIAALRNGGCGFGERSRDLLRRAIAERAFLVIYGHPHSLKTEGPQSQRELEGFLEEATRYRREGRLRIRTAGSLAADEDSSFTRGLPLTARAGHRFEAVGS